MFKRMFKLPKKNSFFLFGPRQTGKSTLIGHALDPRTSWTIDLLEHDTFLRFARDPAQFRHEALVKIRAGCADIFVDEIQKLPPLLDEVHVLMERSPARFILTGSSARKLRHGAANLLGGRALTRRLHPLTVEELGQAFQLDRVLRYGALPPVALLSQPESEPYARGVLESYAQTYLREEIQAEAIVRNLGGFARFLDVAAAQSGDILNYSALGRDAGLAVRTVQDYFQILEDTLIGFRLEAFRKSPRARLVTHPRFYLFDTGVLNALCRRLTCTIDSALRGRLFEHFIVLETARILDYAQSEARLFYWRTNHGAEVDLLIEKHGRLVGAIEIKAKTRVSGADLSGLRAFRDQHPKVPCFVVALAAEPFDLDRVRVLPYRTFLRDIVPQI